MRFPNVFVKVVVPVPGEVEVIPVLGKILGRGILDFLLLACLLIDNYWIWAKRDKKDIIIYQAQESTNNNFILTLRISTSY